jgi:hypothetical protein
MYTFCFLNLFWEYSSVGRFSLFCENRLVPVLTPYYETLIGSHIYIYSGLVRTDQILKIFIFSKFTWFSNRVILAYIITVGSLVQFSKPGSFWEINI